MLTLQDTECTEKRSAPRGISMISVARFPRRMLNAEDGGDRGGDGLYQGNLGDPVLIAGRAFDSARAKHQKGSSELKLSSAGKTRMNAGYPGFIFTLRVCPFRQEKRRPWSVIHHTELTQNG